jgi:hypothetical protein
MPLAEYTELAGREQVDVPESLPEAVKRLIVSRDHCRPEDHVVGDTSALISYPLKLLRYADRSAGLYDLGTDPREMHDLAGALPAKLAALQGALTALTDATPARASGGAWTADQGLTERLRALGYATRK